MRGLIFTLLWSSDCIILQQSERSTSEQLSNAQKYILKLEREGNTLRKGFQETVERLNKYFNHSLAISRLDRALMSGVVCDHRMHSDENLVDRRIVVKLLVTYFDRSSNFNDRNRRDVLQVHAIAAVVGPLLLMLISALWCAYVCVSVSVFVCIMYRDSLWPQY